MAKGAASEPPQSRSKQPSTLDKLIQFDKDVTLRCSVSSGETSLLASLRPLLKLLEFSGHGVLWLAGSIAVMYRANYGEPDLFRMAFNVFLALLLDVAVVGGVKGLFKRKRPPMNSDDMFFVAPVDQYSFPSGHSTRAAMVTYITVMVLPFSATVKFLSILWTILIAMSRVMLGRHHVSDVLCGLFIGCLQGVFMRIVWVDAHNFSQVKTLCTL